MNRSLRMVLVGVMLLAVVTAGSAVGAQSPADAPPADGADIQPGERLGGAIAADNAEFQGEITERSFGIAIAAARTNEAKAEVVAQRLSRLEERMSELEERKGELDAARESGELTEGQYRAKVARLEAERASADRIANQSATAVEAVPADVLAAHGIDLEQVDTLRERARELSGPEVSAIAREIAGPNIGEAPSDRNDADRGPTDTPGVGDVPGLDDDDQNDDDQHDDDGDENESSSLPLLP